MTRLLLTGGHSVEVKTPADEVEKRLADAGWCTEWHEARLSGGERVGVPEYSYVQPTYALFEPVKGRHPVRVRTDAVVAIA